VAAPISVVDRLEPPDAPPVPRAGSPFDEVLRMAQVAGVQLITDHLQAWVAEQLAAMEN
jgi:hypothetical protein